MDSQENTLEQGKEELKNVESTSTEQAEETVETAAEAVENVDTPAENAAVTTEEVAVPTQEVAAPAEEVAAPAEKAVQTAAEDSQVNNAEAEQKVYNTKKEVLQRVKEIAQSDDAPKKDEIDYLKTIFYKLHIAERDADYKAFVDGGGDPQAYQITPDEDEEVFKAEMGLIKEKRAKLFKEQEAEKEANLQKKLNIIEKIKAMVTSPEEANKSYQDFKALQQEWREIKSVPAERASELWRNYQLYVEQFYDLLKLNSEAREYDFKKNLETKTHICENAEKLADEEDIISAFHQLQELHQEFRETGPVAKELREEIWNRFKAASAIINKRHQQHFEELRSKEEDNLAKKTALCEKVEEIAKTENKGSGDWEKHTKDIIAVQAEWKTIGFAPQKMNVKIFERFRAACDDFFGKKAEYFKGLKETFKVNADKKRALIDKVNTLKDSTEWKSTSDKIIAIQNEWKTIGMVPKKLGDQLWEEFLGACNHFFEARNAANAGTRNEEHANLDKKKEIIEKLKALVEEKVDDVQETVQKLVEEYNATGHVPFKEKDKIYEEYHAALDKIYKELNISVAKRRLNKFKDNLRQVADRGENALDSERSRLMRQYEAIKSEVQTYENNLGFLNASSKKGNSLIDEMNRKVQKLKDDMNLVRDKIKAIDAENRNK